MGAGKAAFIKFFAPWCGHCKSMAADWEKLADEWAGSEVGLVAEVDCTIDTNAPICSGVQGYPTVKYGDPSSLEDYQGGRDFDSLKKHAETKLKPSCSPTNLHLCDDAKKAEIEEAEKTFKSEVEKLQAAYKKLQQTKED